MWALVGLAAAAGKTAEQLAVGGVKFEDMHRGGWDPEARLADQERDGVAAEIIYPTVGMLLCNHKDFDYKKACFDAYNLWMAEYCDAHPERLIGVGQTAMRSVEEGIEDLRTMKGLGMKGVMMPGNPGFNDYDDRAYDEFYEAAVELGMPLSFHILTSKTDNIANPQRGPKINGFLAIIRGCQDILGTMVFGGVFERHPKLKVVCVEAVTASILSYLTNQLNKASMVVKWPFRPHSSSRPPSTSCGPSSGSRPSTRSGRSSRSITARSGCGSPGTVTTSP